MSSQRHYFEEPVVRVELARVRFPRVCPVCGAPASILSRIILTSGRARYLNSRWDPYYSPFARIRKDLPQPKTRVLPIYVCEDHHYTDEGDERYKSCCFIVDGFSLAFFFFGLLFLGDAFSRGRPLPFWSVAFTAFFVTSLFLTWAAFRPSAIHKSVQIIGFDPGLQNVLLAFKDKSYQEAIIKENPMASELVSWIAKPGS